MAMSRASSRPSTRYWAGREPYSRHGGSALRAGRRGDWVTGCALLDVARRRHSSDGLGPTRLDGARDSRRRGALRSAGRVLCRVDDAQWRDRKPSSAHRSVPNIPTRQVRARQTSGTAAPTPEPRRLHTSFGNTRSERRAGCTSRLAGDRSRRDVRPVGLPGGGVRVRVGHSPRRGDRASRASRIVGAHSRLPAHGRPLADGWRSPVARASACTGGCVDAACHRGFGSGDPCVSCVAAGDVGANAVQPVSRRRVQHGGLRCARWPGCTRSSDRRHRQCADRRTVTSTTRSGCAAVPVLATGGGRRVLVYRTTAQSAQGIGAWRTIRAGTPATNAPAGTSSRTTAPAAITAPSPMVTPGEMTAWEKTTTSSPITTGAKT